MNEFFLWGIEVAVEVDLDIIEAKVVVIVGNDQDGLVRQIGNLVCRMYEWGLTCRVRDEFGREVYTI